MSGTPTSCFWSHTGGEPPVPSCHSQPRSSRAFPPPPSPPSRPPLWARSERLVVAGGSGSSPAGAAHPHLGPAQSQGRRDGLGLPMCWWLWPDAQGCAPWLEALVRGGAGGPFPGWGENRGPTAPQSSPGLLCARTATPEQVLVCPGLRGMAGTVCSTAAAPGPILCPSSRRGRAERGVGGLILLLH